MRLTLDLADSDLDEAHAACKAALAYANATPNRAAAYVLIREVGRIRGWSEEQITYSMAASDRFQIVLSGAELETDPEPV